MDTDVKAEDTTADQKGPRSGPARAVAQTSVGRAVRVSREEQVTVAGVAISNASRPIPNEEGLTKLDIVRYNESVADWLLPEIAQRPLSLIRCPGGDFGSCHFRRHPENDRDDPGGIPYVRIASLRDWVRIAGGHGA